MMYQPQDQDNYMYSTNSTTTTTTTTAMGWSEDQQAPSDMPTHPEWGVIKEQDFHPLTLKHQRDLEISHKSGELITDFYFWQANLGGYCMANMITNTVSSSEGVFVLSRRIVEGAPHPGRRKKKQL